MYRYKFVDRIIIGWKENHSFIIIIIKSNQTIRSVCHLLRSLRRVKLQRTTKNYNKNSDNNIYLFIYIVLFPKKLIAHNSENLNYN